MATILLVDDIPFMRDTFAYDIKRKSGFEVLTAANGKEAIEMLAKEDIDVVILDLEMPVMDGIETLDRIKRDGFDDIPVIVYTAKGSFQSCVQAVQLGAFNFFDKEEIKMEQLIRVIENALDHRRNILEIRSLRRAARQDSLLVGVSAATEKLRRQIAKIAMVPSNVLIVGESGTGKELVAREIHQLSARAKKSFLAVNCAALPENLVESELFGHEKGAFSGAIKTTKGKFQVADGGTLLLDEIGDMPQPIQAKLLRVLQENEITRLGGEGKVIKVDARVIAATHRNLAEEMEKGNFRQDLYYRICTHLIEVPPLRDRIEDVVPLTYYFVERICERFGIAKKEIRAETITILQSYDWAKNNIRELENIVERMVIQCDGDELSPEHIPSDIQAAGLADLQQPDQQVYSLRLPDDASQTQTFQELKQDAERQILRYHLEQNNWHITKTAQALGIANHSNLLKMMRRLGITRPKTDR